MSHVTCHMSPVMCYLSHTTCHLRLRNTDVVEALNDMRSVGEDKAAEETLTLKEHDNQEVSEEEFDDFSFSGTSSCDPVLMVEGQKRAEILKGEEGEDGRDCFKIWVHRCQHNIFVG